MNFKQAFSQFWKKSGIPYILAGALHNPIYRIITFRKFQDGYSGNYFWKRLEEELSQAILLVVLVRVLGG